MRTFHLHIHSKVELVFIVFNFAGEFVIIELIFGLLIFRTSLTCLLLASNIDADLTEFFSLLRKLYQILASILLDEIFRMPDSLAFAAEAAHGELKTDSVHLRSSDLHNRVNQVLNAIMRDG